jgi:phage FluMu protein Com
MNLRCIYCQTPFTLARSEMLSAIIVMNEKNQSHYDAHCPRCRRANSISRQRMELFFPNWQEAAKQQASMPDGDIPPLPEPEFASVSSKTEPLPKVEKSVAAKKKAVAKKVPAKAAAAKKTNASKPAGKKAPAKGKKK